MIKYIYTVIDECYDVHLCKSIKDIITYVYKDDRYISDGSNKLLLTEETLRLEFVISKETWIFKEGVPDWIYKIQMHRLT